MKIYWMPWFLVKHPKRMQVGISTIIKNQVSMI
ncbi:hypothetical protein VPHF99_0102 [Vibrio phage F99]